MRHTWARKTHNEQKKKHDSWADQTKKKSNVFFSPHFVLCLNEHHRNRIASKDMKCIILCWCFSYQMHNGCCSLPIQFMLIETSNANQTEVIEELPFENNWFEIIAVDVCFFRSFLVLGTHLLLSSMLLLIVALFVSKYVSNWSAYFAFKRV